MCAPSEIYRKGPETRTSKTSPSRSPTEEEHDPGPACSASPSLVRMQMSFRYSYRDIFCPYIPRGFPDMAPQIFRKLTLSGAMRDMWMLYCIPMTRYGKVEEAVAVRA